MNKTKPINKKPSKKKDVTANKYEIALEKVEALLSKIEANHNKAMDLLGDMDNDLSSLRMIIDDVLLDY